MRHRLRAEPEPRDTAFPAALLFEELAHRAKYLVWNAKSPAGSDKRPRGVAGMVPVRAREGDGQLRVLTQRCQKVGAKDGIMEIGYVEQCIAEDA
ncbi:hypothetical protein [Streptomyces sp. NPDC060065]|uniref:hypothetical protein n=1 Tax=Streptomyces sp. NPDC060065 TaxID=3347050 RepID=UPI0036973808